MDLHVPLVLICWLSLSLSLFPQTHYTTLLSNSAMCHSYIGCDQLESHMETHSCTSDDILEHPPIQYLVKRCWNEENSCFWRITTTFFFPSVRLRVMHLFGCYNPNNGEKIRFTNIHTSPKICISLPLNIRRMKVIPRQIRKITAVISHHVFLILLLLLSFNLWGEEGADSFFFRFYFLIYILRKECLRHC